eukprot:5500872-Prorocentrum_lima.AAC.1
MARPLVLLWVSPTRTRSGTMLALGVLPPSPLCRPSRPGPAGGRPGEAPYCLLSPTVVARVGWLNASAARVLTYLSSRGRRLCRRLH